MTNTILNPGFEEPFTDTWKIILDHGAQVSWEIDRTIQRNGTQSLHLRKVNSLGYVILSSKEPVRVEAGATYTLRFWFYAENAQVTSFLIPRLVTDEATPAVANHHSALWVNYDYDAQSLMRNCPSQAAEDWIKRVVFYENSTDQPQDIFIQVALYGNPFDVWLDDFEFFNGKWKGQSELETPGYLFTQEQVIEILEQRGEASASVYEKDGVTHFTVDGEPEWPIFYRSLARKDSSGLCLQDPAGFSAQGIEINNVVLHLAHAWPEPVEYRWEIFQTSLMETLRKNPHARLLLDFHMDPPLAWRKTNSDDTWEAKDGRKLNGASYSSLQWRKDGVEAIKRLIRDLKQYGFWKIVAGINIVGGHDWQFWTKAIGEYAADYSPGNKQAWQTWLQEHHKDIQTLNAAWNTDYSGFSSIPIPDPPSEHEILPAIMPKGLLPDFRLFCEAIAFDLRQCFARAVRQEAGKDLFVSAYGMPMENQHGNFLKMADRSLDMIASMSFYPYRQPGFASGYHPEQSFGFHNIGFLQELDLRYHTSDMGWYDELNLMWCGSQPNIEAWRNMHRKLVGISLAQNQGFWYYDMEKQFVDAAVMGEIGAVKRIADQLVTRTGVEFRPDVCLVRFEAESRYYGSSVDSSVGATVQWQYMLLETSGVPYDVHYLADIMAEPGLQQYKIYIFHNHTYISAAERDWISTQLKNNQRVLIWLYDSGYGTEAELSVDALCNLVGMKIATETGYTRSVVQITGSDRFVGGEEGFARVPAFQGMAEALCGVFARSGSASLEKPYFLSRFGYMVAPGVSRYQRFWVENGFDNALATYIEDGKAAMTVKRFPDWTSVYIGAPNGLAGEMLNNIAQSAGAYRCGPPAMGEMRLSGRFASYHALRSGCYDFRLPPGTKRVIDAETGKILAENVKSYAIEGKAQFTYWLFIE